MNKKNAGERKRTVTVVIGPRTVKVLEDLAVQWQAETGRPMGDWTTFVGVALDEEIKARQNLLHVPVWTNLDSHFN